MGTNVDVCTYRQMLTFLLLVPRCMFEPTLYLVISIPVGGHDHPPPVGIILKLVPRGFANVL